MPVTYRNPWSSYQRLTLSDIIASISLRPCNDSAGPAERIPVSTKANFAGQQECEVPRAMWLGHAGVLLQLPGSGAAEKGGIEGEEGILRGRNGNGTVNVLFDPIFSERCSPISWIGPKRRLAAPCEVKDLPEVHVVIISHDHYDHLDKKTIRDLERYHGSSTQYFVPRGVGRILRKFGVPASKIHELGWWDEETISPQPTAPVAYSDVPNIDTPSTLVATEMKEYFSDEKESPPPSPSSPDIGGMRVICTPAQHNSGRTLCGKNKTLWATWLVEYRLPNGKLWRCFFGGDTGYQSQDGGPVCPVFREITTRYGPTDLALLPIAHGSVLPYLSSLLPLLKFDAQRLVSVIHCSPAHALDIHHNLQVGATLPIHWGTWTSAGGARGHAKDMREACERMGVKFGWEESLGAGFGMSDVGVWKEVRADTSVKSVV
ncbi:hypothetical protein IAT38_006242 [Cryptococcus sp. DSM 104549]